MNTGKLIAIVLIASVIGGYVGGLVGGNQSDPGSVGGTTNLDALTLDNGSFTSITGDNALGTTTITLSYDGFIAHDNVTVATGTAKGVITNSTGVDWMCKAGSVYTNGTTFAPSLVISVGTSTSATGDPTAIGLLASTTIASTTDTVINVNAWNSGQGSNFILPSGQSILLEIYDGTTGVASSTYFSNWDIDMDFPCWMLDED